MFHTHKILFSLFILIASTSLTGCGGGSSGEAASSSAALPQFTSESALMLDLVNKARATTTICGTETMPPVPALTWNALLSKSSLAHAQDMYEKNYFDHISLDGTDPSVRISRAGYKWRAAGENIAKGYPTIESVVDAWLKSPGHCKNIMEPMFTELGDAEYNRVWVQNFGTPL